MKFWANTLGSATLREQQESQAYIFQQKSPSTGVGEKMAEAKLATLAVNIETTACVLLWSKDLQEAVELHLPQIEG